MLGVLLSFFLIRPTAPPSSAGETCSSAPTALLPPLPSPVSTQTSDCRPWDRTAVYSGGDQVLYRERIYRAKWWTQGEAPGNADVWEDTGEAPMPPVSSPAVSPAPPERSEGFLVLGYFPSWKGDALDSVRLDLLTHVVYAFAIPTAAGGLRPLDNPDAARALVERAHAAGTKVLLGVGGWSYDDVPLESTFVLATETQARRDALADAILSLCEEYGFDGVDMDWEHPRVDGPSASQYEALMLTLAGRLHEEGKLLTCAVLSGATADGNLYYDAAAHSDQVLDAVDYVNIMAYDGGDGERHSPYDFAVACAAYWNEIRGVPGEKLLLGLPFYSRPGWASYREILAQTPDAWQGDSADYHGTTVWYNSPDTIRQKTAYALERLGGVMIWEITQDTDDTEHSLLEAIVNAERGTAP